MKTFLVIATVFGMTSSAALADCAGHVTASAGVDKEITTASIATPATEKRNGEATVLKSDRLPGQTPAEAEATE
ncbi:hypothetical protein KX729_19275 [Rhizobium sp. XQZ8]|uniref:hypothetical protein n=1 Tax=Rhizobium populisoli TaxID=2859785 RepID=UPI001CA46FC0|nr:hypothetical protein [Rhizobium populisoli]MBW6423604.1 hypothetical protein [Rhizobium populisoli]